MKIKKSWKAVKSDLAELKARIESEHKVKAAAKAA